MQKHLHLVLLIFTLIFSSCRFSENNPDVSITFSVVVNKSISQNKVYIAGNHKLLGEWNADRVALHRINDTLFSRTFTFPQNTKLEYKFTLGSWFLESLTDEGKIPANSTLTTSTDTIVVKKVSFWRSQVVDGGVLITPNLLADYSFAMYLLTTWRFNAIDSSHYSLPEYTENYWVNTISNNPSPKTWNGFGWFRLKLTVDSSLFGTTFAIRISHFGASEVFFNGIKLFRIGNIGDSSSPYTPVDNRLWYSGTFTHDRFQYFAVRYKNYDYKAI